MKRKTSIPAIEKLAGAKTLNRHSTLISRNWFMLAGGLLLLPALTQACSTNWTGAAGDGVWHNKANWSTGLAPTSNDDVCIDAGSNVTVGFPVVVNSLNNAGFLSLNADLFLGATTASANSGTIDLQNGGALTNNVATLVNTGTLRGSATIGNAGVAPILQNTGNVVVQAGRMTLAHGGNSGSFVAGLGAELDLGFFTMNSGASLSGLGTIAANMFGTITFNADLTIEVATFLLANGTIDGFGDLTFTNTLNWSGGTIMGGFGVVNFASTATVNILGGAQQNRTINNAGKVAMSGAGTLNMGVLTAFNNQAGATFDIQNNGTINGGATSAFNNAGTLRRSAGNLAAQIAVFLDNTGTVVAQSGTLGLDNAKSSGVFSAGIGAELDLAVVTINSGASLSGLGTIAFKTFGTLTFNTDIGIGVARFIFANGTVKGPGNVTFNNILNWSGGIMGGTGVINFASTAIVNILGNVQQNQTINNAGNVIVSGVVIVQLFNGAVFNNGAGASFDFQGDGSLTGAGASAFNNAGLLKKSSGTGNSVMGPLPVNNSGNIAAQSGTLTLSGGGASGGVLSSFSASPGATLAYGGGTYIMDVGAGLGGGGTIAINGATVTFKVDIAIETATVAFISGTVNGAGVVTIRHTLNWSGGTMSGLASGATLTNISSTGSVNISGTVTLDSRTLTTSLGAIGKMVGSGCIVMAGGAIVNNTGSFDIQVDCGAIGSGTWNNDGSLKKSAGPGLAVFSVTFNNNGTVLVQSGSIVLTGGGSNAGTMTPSAGATLALSAGTFTVTSVISFTGGGTVLLNGAVLTFAADTSISTAIFSFTAGVMTGAGHATFNDTLDWSGGTMSGTGSTNIAANAVLNLTGAGVLTTRTINSIGAIVMSGAGGLAMSGGAVLNNQTSGVFDIQNDGGIAFGGAPPPAFHNDGTFKKSAGAGTSAIAVAFTNTSLVQALSGTIFFTSTYVQSAGSTILNGGSLGVSSPNSIDIEGGSLSGSGTITGTVVNKGTVKAGAATPGVISVNGGYTQGPTGVLNIGIVGATPGTGYSQLKISGAASLNGTLNIALNFTPGSPAAFVVMTFASEAGNFTTISGLDAGGVTLRANLNPNDLTLVASATASTGLQFVPVSPCRVMDTRNPNGSLGSPFIAAGSTRTVPIPSSACGIPLTAQAYALNITVAPRAGSLGYLTVWPAGQAQPNVSTLNSPDGLVLANAAIVPAGTGGSINAFATNDADVIIDINGYFVPPGSNTLQFFPLSPCRVLDTRNTNGFFGGPAIAGGSSRSFPIPTSSCKVPGTAAAYSFNVTVAPQGGLGYLTAWPTGQTQPLVSTLNSVDGAILANAAIVAAGSGGAVSLYASNTTDVVVDINGYFAPPATGGLNFYTLNPCRLVDTRNPNGPLAGPVIAANASRAFPLLAGSCGLPNSAAAYSLNMTVVPSGVLGYLSTWPAGQAQPLVSTLNALKGRVVANAALVPAGTGGSVSVFVTDPTQVIIDTNGYFGAATADNVTHSLALTSRTGAETNSGRQFASGRQPVVTPDVQQRLANNRVSRPLPTQFGYDSRRWLSTTQAGFRGTSAYDSNGRLASITNPLHFTTRFAYDGAGNLMTVTLADGRTIGYTYDGNGNVTSVTPPNGFKHAFSYTGANLLSSYTPPSVGGTGPTSYAYDQDYQLKSVTRPDGNPITFFYDGAGRLSTTATPAETIHYAYSVTTGKLTAVSVAGGEGLTYAYDGPLLAGVAWTGGVAGAIVHTHNNKSLPAAQTVDSSKSIAFNYDNEEMLTAAGALSIQRDSQNGLITGTALGGATDSRTYDSLGGLTGYVASYNGMPVYAEQLTTDALGRIVSKVESIGGKTKTQAYTYDATVRLTQVNQDGVTAATYSYDNNSNRLIATTASGSVIGGYDGQDRLHAYGDASYTYTANGELASQTVGERVTSYTYDVLGNLIAVTLPNGTGISYVVDGQSRRVGKKVNNVLVTGFLYDGNRIVAQLNGGNAVVSQFIYAARKNSPDYMIKGGQTYRIFSDHLGSPRLVVDTATGEIMEEIDYDEFGNVLTDSNPGFQPFRFAGGLYDRDTKLVWLGARDYDPKTARWTCKDPNLFRGGEMNLNAYVLTDPINPFNGISIGGTDGGIN